MRYLPHRMLSPDCLHFVCLTTDHDSESAPLPPDCWTGWWPLYKSAYGTPHEAVSAIPQTERQDPGIKSRVKRWRMVGKPVTGM